ncbi:MAG: hypothetical protein ACR2JW_04390 [Thermomicrobiales bacterium]
MPQLPTSVERSAQAPLQFTVPLGQTVTHTPLLQRPLVQSVPTRHCLPTPHFEQVGPPQSTSVSLPFFTPSTHAGGWHRPSRHTPLGHVAPLVQAFWHVPL